MNLAYNLQAAMEAGVVGHAESIMKMLGITYKRAVPQTLYDAWWFYDCANVPDTLPPYLKVIVGHGY